MVLKQVFIIIIFTGIMHCSDSSNPILEKDF